MELRSLQLGSIALPGVGTQRMSLSWSIEARVGNRQHTMCCCDAIIRGKDVLPWGSSSRIAVAAKCEESSGGDVLERCACSLEAPQGVRADEAYGLWGFT